MKRPHNSGRLDRGMPPPAPGPGPTRRGHHPRSPAALTAVPLPGRAQQAGGDGGTRNGALRRLRRQDAIAEGANRVSPPDAAGPVTADPHARIVHSPGEPVRPPSRTADAPGPPARTVGQQPGGTIDLRTRDAPPYRCGQLQLAPVWRAARGTSDLCRVIGWWRAEYPDRHRQRSDRYRLAVRAERRLIAQVWTSAGHISWPLTSLGQVVCEDRPHCRSSPPVGGGVGLGGADAGCA